MDLWIVFLKATLSMLVIFILTKIMGRKQISQLNLFDYVVGITIGSIAAEIAVNLETNFLNGLIAMSVYTIISIILSYSSIKSIKFRSLVSGKPIIVMDKGKLLPKAMMKAKIDLNDLLQEARANGYFDISQLEYIIMEPNGKFSYLTKSKYNNPTLNDLKIKSPYIGLTLELVADGVIMHQNLKIIGKDEEWLKTRLNNMHFPNIKNIFLASIDTSEKITVYLKEE